MATQLIQVRRGTEAQLGSYGALQAGELGFTTDARQVYVGDGSNNHLVGKVLTGTSGARPAAGVSGRLYFETDTENLYIDDGSNWKAAGVKDMDSLADGSTYGKVKLTELESGQVKQIRAVTGTADITGDTIKTHLDDTSVHKEHPAASTNNGLAVYDGTTGDLKDGGYLKNDSGSGVNDLWSANKIASEIQTSTQGVSAGAGLTEPSTNVFAVNPGDGIDVVGDAVAVDVTDFLDTSYGLTEDTNNIRVNLDASGGLEFNSGAIRLEAAVAGAGLTHTSGVLAVGAGTGINVDAGDIDVKYDNSSIGITGDALYVMNGGVTNDMLGGSISDTKLASDYIYANGSRSMSSDLNLNTNKIIGVATPTLGTDAVNKTYVDSAISGITWKTPVEFVVHYVKTSSGAPASGAGCVTNELCLNTADDTLYIFTSGSGWSTSSVEVSGDQPAEDGRYLFSETGADTSGNSGTYTADNKIYTYNGATFDSASPAANHSVITKHGGYNVLTDSGWTYDDDTSAWIQFTGAGQLTAGDGLGKSGNTLYVNTGNGLGIDTYNDQMRVVEEDLIDTDYGLETTGGTPTGNIRVKLDPNGGLEHNGSTGIKLEAAVAGAGLAHSTGVFSVLASGALALEGDYVALQSHGDSYHDNAYYHSGDTMLGSDGTAGAPTFSFASDTNSGMYRAGADSIGFATNSTGRVTIDDDSMNVGDNYGINFGVGEDLRIYHDGTNNRIRTDNGTIYIQSGASEQMIAAIPDAAVELYYNNVKKFETSNTGAIVTGTLVSDGLSLGDGETLIFGASDDLTIQHDGSANYVTSGNGDIYLYDGGNAQHMVGAVPAGAVDLYYNGVKKFETTNTGATVTGTLVADGVSVGDSENISIGIGNDLTISHDGTHNYLNTYNGNIYIYDETNSDNMIDCFVNGAVQLHYDGSAKVATSNTGVTVTGVASADGFDAGDSEPVRLGASNDFQLNHDGTKNNIVSTNGRIDIMNNSEDMARFNPNGSVSLYHDNVTKFATTTTGINVEGRVTTDDGNAGAPAISFEDDANTGLYRVGSDNIGFSTGGTSRMDVSDGGLVLANGTRINEFSTDGTMAGDSDDAVPTEKAVKAYIDTSTAGVSAGGGLIETAGNVFAVNAGDGIDVVGDAVAVDVTDFLDTSYGLTEDTNNIRVNLDGSGGLEHNSTTGIRLKAAVAGAGLGHSTGVLSVVASGGIEVAGDYVRLSSSASGDGLVWDSANSEFDVGQGDGITVAAASVAVNAADLNDASYSVGVTSNNFRVILDPSGGLEHNGTTGIRLEAAVAGDGIKHTSGVLNIEPNDFAGTGLVDDGSDNLKVNLYTASVSVSGDGDAVNNPLYLDSTNGMNVKIDNDSIKLDGANSHRLIVGDIDGGSF